MPPKKNEQQDDLSPLEAPQEQADNQDSSNGQPALPLVPEVPLVPEFPPVVPEDPEQQAPNGLMYGNKDVAKAHPFPKDWDKSVVVHQCSIEQMNGGVVEVPNTHTLQTYAPDVYDRLSNADLKDKTSFFSESKMKVVVLHDPRG